MVDAILQHNLQFFAFFGIMKIYVLQQFRKLRQVVVSFSVFYDATAKLNCFHINVEFIEHNKVLCYIQ